MGTRTGPHRMNKSLFDLSTVKTQQNSARVKHASIVTPVGWVHRAAPRADRAGSPHIYTLFSGRVAVSRGVAFLTPAVTRQTGLNALPGRDSRGRPAGSSSTKGIGPDQFSIEQAPPPWQMGDWSGAGAAASPKAGHRGLQGPGANRADHWPGRATAFH